MGARTLLRRIWKQAGRPCAVLLKPVLALWLESLRRAGERLDETEVSDVLRMSARTIDRRLSGVRPRRVLIFTTPDDISPYSTLGTPVMTSTDSIFDDAMLLVLMPLNEPLLEFVKEALLLSLTPSTSTAVVKELLPPSALPPRAPSCFLP